MKITGWIQRSDYSSIELGTIDLHSGLKQFREFDWSSELQRRAKLETGGEDCCDPGMGYVSEDDRILHICPIGEGRIYFHYHYTLPRKIFGLPIGWYDKLVSCLDLNIEEVPTLVQNFFVGDHESFIRRAA